MAATRYVVVSVAKIKNVKCNQKTDIGVTLFYDFYGDIIFDFDFVIMVDVDVGLGK